MNTFPPCIMELLNMKCFFFLEEPCLAYICPHLLKNQQLNVRTYAIRGSCVDCFRRTDVIGRNKAFSSWKLQGKRSCPKRKKNNFWNTSRFLQWMFPEIVGFSPQIIHGLIRFSQQKTSHFGGTPIFGNTHIVVSMVFLLGSNLLAGL